MYDMINEDIFYYEMMIKDLLDASTGLQFITHYWKKDKLRRDEKNCHSL